MGRPKGSKNRKPSVVVERTISPPKKPKKIVQNSTKDKLQEIAKKKGRPPMPKYVLKLTDYLYITCDSRCWMIKEVNEAINPVTGEKYPDKPFLYATRLCDILHVAANYMIRIPADIEMLSKKMDDIYNLIDVRVPKNTRPKDLFEVFQSDQETEDEDI